MSIFVRKYTKLMTDKIIHSLQEYYEQDYLLMAVKTIFGMILLNIPQWLIETEGVWKGVSAIVGMFSAFLGCILLILKVYDQFNMRYKKYKNEKNIKGN